MKANMSRMGKQMADGDPAAANAQPSPFASLMDQGGGGGGGGAKMNRQGRLGERGVWGTVEGTVGGGRAGWGVW